MLNKTYILIKSKNDVLHKRLKKIIKTNRQNKILSVCDDNDFIKIQPIVERQADELQVCTASYNGKNFAGIKNEEWVKPDINDDKYLAYLRARKRRLHG